MTIDLNEDQCQRIASAVAFQSRLEYESSSPKAPHGDIRYKGVMLSSRYDVLSEFSSMRAAINAMPELVARRLASIWCDSHAGASYVVQVRPEFYLDDLPQRIEDAFKSLGGYNGLSILCEGRSIPHRDCYWPEYDNQA